MRITVNGRPVECSEEDSVLVAATRAGIDIPHLCSLDWAPSPSASCRLCIVEVEGMPRLMTSCTLKPTEGMAVKTHSPRILAARRNIVELLLASHPSDCLVCARSTSCELSRIAADLGVRERRYQGVKKAHAIDLSSPSIERDPNKCVLCGRCVTMCQNVQAVGAIDFTDRGFRTQVAPGFHNGLNVSGCIFCGQCVRVCPTGALIEKSHLEGVVEALADPNAVVVAQVAPAVPAALMEENDVGSVRGLLGRLAGALKRVGFGAVFDTCFAADLTIMEEVSELLRRVQRGGVLPMFTSCSPAWVRYVELHAPDLIPHLSTCKSPQQMAGALIKRYYPKHADLGGRRIVSVSIMPCTAKKYEASEDGDVDFVLTTRELERLLARFGLDFATWTESAPLDPPFSSASGAGRLFGGTGGVMEAAIRTAFKMLTGAELATPKIELARGLEGIKKFEIDVNGTSLGFGIVNGIGRLKTMLDPLRNGELGLHFIEVMSCPGGCVGGGGQPYSTDMETVRDRLERLYDADKRSAPRVSHDNDEVRSAYEDLLGEPLGQISHSLLHRHYVDRSKEEVR